MADDAHWSGDSGDLPRYDDLPPAPDGGRSAWGLFGPDDNVGLVNLMTPDRIREAAQLIRRGAVFPLDAPLDAFDPPIAATRGVPRHRLLHPPGTFAFDDVYDNFYPQASSQWDSLGHVGYGPDQFYNGATEQDIVSGRRNGVDHWARHGIVGRAVLIDLPRTFAEAGRPYDIAAGPAYSVADLESARERSGFEYRSGDVLVIHTGFSKWFSDQTTAARYALQRSMVTPGIEHGEDMCRYLWDAHIAAVVSDTFAVEAFPPERGSPLGFAHRVLIGQFGMALGELWWTEDLAADCAQDGIYEAFLASAPMNARGGIGSPANAIAIK